MKTFTTTILVPANSKAQLNAMQQMEMNMKMATRGIPINDDLGTGALDDLKDGDEFILVVNGEVEKHQLKMKVSAHAAGYPRLMFVEPQLPEVKRFIEWRVDQTKRMVMKGKTQYQLRNFTTEDLRRLIRSAYAMGERHRVNYR